jgi:hypothetical protein
MLRIPAVLLVGTLTACGARVESLDPNIKGNDLTGTSPDASADAPAVTSPDTSASEPTCATDNLEARLAAVSAACAAGKPTRSYEMSVDPVANKEFQSFVLGRWLFCPGAKAPGIPGPKGHVGIEFAPGGRAYFLTVSCAGAIVRGSGGEPDDASLINSWENWYTFNPATGGQFEIYYGGPPTGSWRGMNILHGTFDTKPARFFVDVMGVYESLYVRAPESL